VPSAVRAGRESRYARAYESWSPVSTSAHPHFRPRVPAQPWLDACESSRDGLLARRQLPGRGSGPEMTRRYHGSRVLAVACGATEVRGPRCKRLQALAEKLQDTRRFRRRCRRRRCWRASWGDEPPNKQFSTVTEPKTILAVQQHLRRLASHTASCGAADLHAQSMFKHQPAYSARRRVDAGQPRPPGHRPRW